MRLSCCTHHPPTIIVWAFLLKTIILILLRVFLMRRGRTPLSSLFSSDYWGLSLNDSESHKSYRPLTVLSFRANHYLHGLWSPGFHAVNVAAHGFVCCLYFWSCMSFGAEITSSVFASLLFTSHPIHTEAVSIQDPYYCHTTIAK